MKAVLLSNVSHYAYTAEALHRAGYLNRMVTGPMFAKVSPLATTVPRARSVIEQRTFPGLKNVRLTRTWLPEIADRALVHLGIHDESYRFRIANRMYDLRTLPHVKACDVFHFVNGVALLSARQAKKAGAVLICDQRSTHPFHEQRIVSEESRSLGVPYRHPETAFMDWVLEEYELADMILCASDYAAKTFTDEGVDRAKLHIIPLGCELVRADTGGRENSASFTVLFVGGVVPRKGVRYLLEAFHKITDRRSRLVLVGTLPTAMERLLASADERVLHIPFLRRAALRRLYCDASVLVLPALADAWGLVVLEAMAEGVPVIVTEEVGAASAVRNGHDGFVIPARDANAIANCLNELIAQPDLLKAMGENARKRAHEFSWHAYGDRVVQLYDCIATRRHAHHR